MHGLWENPFTELCAGFPSIGSPAMPTIGAEKDKRTTSTNCETRTDLLRNRSPEAFQIPREMYPMTGCPANLEFGYYQLVIVEY